MKKKIIGILVMTLLISVTVLPVTGTKNIDNLNEGSQVVVEAPQVFVPSEREEITEKLNRGNDVLVAGQSEDEYKSTIASDRSGNLYIALCKQYTYEEIHVYKSTNNGKTWTWFTGGTSGYDLSNPSIAIGSSGYKDRLLVAFQGGTVDIWVHWRDLNNPDLYDFIVVDSNPYGVCNPNIVTDCDSYIDWYAYIIWNSEVVGMDREEYWTILCARSDDYGESWEGRGGVGGYGSVSFPPSDIYPDLDFGHGSLYVTWHDKYSGYADTDIYVIKSDDRAGDFYYLAELTTPGGKNEYNPSVAAVKGLSSNKNVIVAYNHEYDVGDNDIHYAYTLDGGAHWTKNNKLIESWDDEKNPDLATTYNNKGAFHIAYWQLSNIYYDTTVYSDPTAWTGPTLINEGNSASGVYKPSIAANANQPVDREAAIAWDDFRNAGTAMDIYFDSLIPPNTCPFAPVIDGPLIGEPNWEYNYNFNADDPDDDQVKYHINWGDGNSESTDFYPDETDVTAHHTWEKSGVYTITAYAEDTEDNAGPSSTLEVTIPRDKAINTPILNFFGSHPNLFPILQLLLQKFGL